MRKKRKLSVRIGLRVVAVLVIALPFLAAGCHVMMPGEIRDASKAAREFSARHPDAFSTRHGIHAAVTGSGDRGTIFLVHGSPGDWKAFGPYLASEALTEDYRIVAFDRPGYGASSPGETMRSMADQGDRLALRAEEFSGPRIWLGHSFGAPIVARVAVDHPQLVDGLILSASAMDPDLEQPRWFHHLGGTRIGRAVLPATWDVTNQECLAFTGGLEILAGRLHEIRAPVILMHAKNDSLSRFAHLAWTEKSLRHAPVETVVFEKGDHFILWNRVEETIAAIRRLGGK